MFNLIKTANHNLLRNKVRTFLTILAIFVGSFTIILTSGIHTGVNAFIDEQTAGLGGDDYLAIAPKSTMNSLMSTMSMNSEPVEYNPDQRISYLSEKDIEKIKNLDGIKKDTVHEVVMPQITYITSDKTDKKYNIIGESMVTDSFNIEMQAGNLPLDNTTKYEIALQPGYVEVLGFDNAEDVIGQVITLAVQDPITQQTKNFTATVTGVMANSLVTTGSSMLSLPLGNAIYAENTKYSPTMANQALMVQARFDSANYSATKIKDILEDAGYVGITVDDMMGLIRSFFDAIMIVFTIFGGIALLAAAIGIVNTLFMSVEERTREIGLDKALGMSSGRVFAEFATEAILLGFWGSVFGILVAIIAGVTTNIAVHAPGAFLEVFPTFDLFKFTFGNILPLMLAIMLISLLAGTAPAIKAAKKDPIEALRYE